MTARDLFDAFTENDDRGRFGERERRPPRGRVTGASDLIDLTLTLRVKKPLAIAVADPADLRGIWIWLPRSQIEFEEKGRGVVVVTLPEWLAVDKGLVK